MTLYVRRNLLWKLKNIIEYRHRQNIGILFFAHIAHPYVLPAANLFFLAVVIRCNNPDRPLPLGGGGGALRGSCCSVSGLGSVLEPCARGEQQQQHSLLLLQEPWNHFKCGSPPGDHIMNHCIFRDVKYYLLLLKLLFPFPASRKALHQMSACW